MAIRYRILNAPPAEAAKEEAALGEDRTDTTPEQGEGDEEMAPGPLGENTSGNEVWLEKDMSPLEEWPAAPEPEAVADGEGGNADTSLPPLKTDDGTAEPVPADQ
jgi:hypothetical protein